MLVLDGAEEAQNLNAVLHLSDSNGVLITTRRRQDAPDQRWRRELEPLPDKKAVDLLNAWQSTDVSGVVGQSIVEQVGRLPLAVRLAGRYLDQSGESPATYLRWLKDSPDPVAQPGRAPGGERRSFARQEPGPGQRISPWSLSGDRSTGPIGFRLAAAGRGAGRSGTAGSPGVE